VGVYLPEHRFGLPELVLENGHKAPPDQVIEADDVNHVDYEYRAILHELKVKATSRVKVSTTTSYNNSLLTSSRCPPQA
jgi:hypothetical protein